jgi:hypothetical protein
MQTLSSPRPESVQTLTGLSPMGAGYDFSWYDASSAAIVDLYKKYEKATSPSDRKGYWAMIELELLVQQKRIDKDFESARHNAALAHSA